MPDTYPANYPAPDISGYTGSSTYGLSRTGLPTSNPRQIKTFNAANQVIGMSFSMTQDLYAEWICWMNQHMDWFYLDTVTPRTPVNITSTNLFRMISGTQQTKRGHNYISVSASFEMIPGAEPDPLSPAHVWLDFIVAGSPSSPSSDIIDAGTPASPSINWVTADLYGYE